MLVLSGCGAGSCAGGNAPAGPPAPASATAQAGPGAAAADAVGPADRAAARDLLRGAELPERAEVVAAADRLAIAASRADKPKSAELLLLAARLRERLWRLDKVASDGREAAELYATAADAFGADPGGCEADLARGALSGELAHDAAETFAALYTAHERQAALPSSSAGAQPPADRGPCLERMRRLIDSVAAFRPTGQAWIELQDSARRDAEEHLASIAASASAPTASATGAASADPSASAAPPAPAGPDVVVKPDEATLKPDAQLRHIQPYSWPGGGRLVLTLSAPARYEVGALAPEAAAGRGDRVYLDLGATAQKGLRSDLDAKGLITGVRLGKRDSTAGKNLRVVIDLSAPAHHRVFYLPDPFRVVVDLSTRQAAAPEQPKSGRRAAGRVVLDPGHGGWDAGAVGPTGLREKDVALDIAHRAAPALATELGIETLLTRDTDVFVPLEERTARANAFHADLFVSIHCNATEDGHAEGIEIYMLDPTRQTDAAALRAVARENREKEQARPLDPRLLDQQIASIAAGLRVADVTERSRTFAQLLRTSTLGSLARYGARDHGVKTASFFVLLGAEMPAALFETAFISNPEDEQKLGTADFRQKLADAIVNAVRAYRDGLAPKL